MDISVLGLGGECAMRVCMERGIGFAIGDRGVQAVGVEMKLTSKHMEDILGP